MKNALAEILLSSETDISSTCPSDVENWTFSDGSDCSLRVLCDESIEMKTVIPDELGDASMIPNPENVPGSITQNATGILN